MTKILTLIFSITLIGCSQLPKIDNSIQTCVLVGTGISTLITINTLGTNLISTATIAGVNSSVICTLSNAPKTIPEAKKVIKKKIKSKPIKDGQLPILPELPVIPVLPSFK